MTNPILYESNETVFNHSGIGSFSDAIKAHVTQEKHGKFELELEYPVGGKLFNELKNDRIIKAHASHRLKNQWFKIIRVSKPSKGKVKVYTEHVSYLAEKKQLNPSVSFSGNAQMVLQQWANAIVDDHPFTVYSNVSTASQSGTWTIDNFDNAREVLWGKEGSILQSFGGEYLFDNYDIRLLQQRGVDNGVPIAYGKNLIDLEQEDEISSTYTALYPFAFDEDENLITLPEIFIDTEHVEKYQHRLIRTYDFSNDDIQTVKQLRNRAQRFIDENNMGVPNVNLKVNFLELAKTEEYKDLIEAEDIGLCDWVTISFEKLGIKTKAQIIKTVWDVLRDEYYEIEVGQPRESFSHTVQTVVQSNTENLQKLVENVRRQANGINQTYESPNEPTGGNYRVGDTWIRPIEDGHYELYIWDGAMWAFLLSTKGMADLEEAIEQNKLIVEEAKEAAEEAALAGAEAKIVGEQAKAAGELAQQMASESSAQAATALQELNELDTSINQAVQAAGFTSLENVLTSHQSNISTSLANAAEALAKSGTAETIAIQARQTATSLEQSITEVQSTANQAVVTANQAVATANSWSSTITRIETNLDNLDTTDRIAYFDGNSGVRLIDHDIPQLQQTDASGRYGFTLMIRFYTESTIIRQAIFHQADNTLIEIQAGGILRIFSNGIDRFFSSQIQGGKWYEIVLSRRDDLFRVYLNGTPLAETNVNTAPRIFSTAIDIGNARSSSAGARYLNGYIEYVALFGGAIGRDFFVNVTKQDPLGINDRVGANLIGYWNMTDLNDRSGNEQHLNQLSNSDLVRFVPKSILNEDTMEWTQTQISQTETRVMTSVTNNTNKIAAQEITLNGVQTTVTNKADQTQVTQLENQFTVLSHTVQRNLLGVDSSGNADHSQFNWDGINGGLHDTSGTGFVVNYTGGNNDTTIGTVNRIWRGIGFESGNTYTIKIRVNSSGDVSNAAISIGQAGGSHNERISTTGTARTHTFTYYANSSNAFSIFFHRNARYRIHQIEVYEGGGASQAQLSILNEQINLRVSKNDVVNQINVSTESILIAGNKVHITGQTSIDSAVIQTAHIADVAINTAKIANLAVSSAKIQDLAVTTAKIANAAITSAKIGTATIGTAHIGDGVITNAKIGNAQITGAKIQDATISSAKIINLDVSRISGNTSEFVRTQWNNAVGNTVSIDGNGFHSVGTTTDTTPHLNHEVNIANGEIYMESDVWHSTQNIGISSVRLYGGGIMLDQDFVHAAFSPTTGVLLQHHQGMLGMQLSYDGLRFVNGDSTAFLRFNGTNLVFDNMHLGLRGHHINSVLWLRLYESNTHLQSHPTQSGAALIDSSRLALGIGDRDNFTDGLVLTSGLVNAYQSLNMRANDIQGVTRVSLGGSTTDLLSSSDGSRGVLRSGQGLILGIRTGSGIANTSRRIEITGRIDFFANLWMQGNNIGNVGEISYMSDARLKENFAKPTESALEKHMKLNYQLFDWKDRDRERQLGLVAQQVREIDSTLVEIDREGMYNIRTSRYLDHIGLSLQELAMRHDELKISVEGKQQAMINHLENKVEFLETRLEKAEKEINQLKGEAA